MIFWLQRTPMPKSNFNKVAKLLNITVVDEFLRTNKKNYTGNKEENC